MMMTTGCTLTLNSVFTSGDVVYDPALEGVWQTPSAIWTIKPYDKNSGWYQLQTEMKDQQSAEWLATLGTIGTNRFLELNPKRPNEIHQKTFYGGHFVALRSFWKVSLRDDTLTLTPMATQWFEALTKQQKTNLKFEKPEGGLLFLTASTKELQEFIAKHADDEGAFPMTGDEKGFTLSRGNRQPK